MRPLVTLNVFPSLDLTVASVRLCTGSNGWKCTHVIALSESLSFNTGEHGQIDRVVVVRAQCQRTIKNDLLGGDITRS